MNSATIESVISAEQEPAARAAPAGISLTQPPLQATAIAVQGLSKSFGSTAVLHDINLSIEAGKVTCLSGPSGSGKSTLLRCMAFLEEATAGGILINGQPLGFETGPGGERKRLSEPRIREVRSQIGMCFQQFNLWPHMTALDNVCEALVSVKNDTRRCTQDRHGPARQGGPAGARQALPGAAVRRSAAARGDCPGVGDGTGGNAV